MWHPHQKIEFQDQIVLIYQLYGYDIIHTTGVLCLAISKPTLQSRKTGKCGLWKASTHVGIWTF